MDESSPDDTLTRTEAALIKITCPVWCEVSAEEHALRLWANEGRCVHRAVILLRTRPAMERRSRRRVSASRSSWSCT
jgi:hypothetical protein